MPCTTILVGKKASYDGSTMIARNDDSPSGQFTPKKFVVVHPEEQPRKYKSVLSHVEIDLPEEALRYTAVPNALEGEGIWAAHGINAAGVGMTATETITSNARVLGADPLVEYVPAQDGAEALHHQLILGLQDSVIHRSPQVNVGRANKDRGRQLLRQVLPDVQHAVLVAGVRQADGGHQQPEGVVRGQAADRLRQAHCPARIHAADVHDGVKGAEVFDLVVGHRRQARPPFQRLGILLGRAVTAAVENDTVHKR